MATVYSSGNIDFVFNPASVLVYDLAGNPAQTYDSTGTTPTSPSISGSYVSFYAAPGLYNVVARLSSRSLNTYIKRVNIQGPITVPGGGTVDPSKQPLNDNLTAIASIDPTSAPGVLASDGSGWFKKTYSQVKTALSLSKTDVGLSNVDNTSDVNKPVSSAQATADTAVANYATSVASAAQTYAVQRANHTGTQSAATITGLANVATTGQKSDIGLGNVDNTSDVNKPVSTAQATADAAVSSYAVQRANHTGTQAISTVVNLQSSLDAKAPLASPALTGSATMNGALLVVPWSPNTNFAANQWVLAPGGYLAQRISTGTSGATYDPTQWVEYGGGKEINSASLSSTFTPVDNTIQDVTGMSIMVPANSGNAYWQSLGPVILSITTGTNAATVSQRVSIYVTDSSNNQIGQASGVTIYGTGTSQSPSYSVPFGVPIPNSSSDQTYKMRVQVQRLGTASATGSVVAGGAFGNLVCAVVRR